MSISILLLIFIYGVGTIQIMRKRQLFVPKKPFNLSRSKIELFLSCPRCFYLDRRLGIGQVQGPAFTLNSAVDALLKNEFDIYRGNKEPHPLMIQYGIDGYPYAHENLDEWRNNFTGIRYTDPKTRLTIFGAIDDVWIDSNDELHVVDYKATSTQAELTLDAPYRDAYKRQMEIYQWLLRNNNFPVSSVGYFVYANGKKNEDLFDGRLEFDVEILSYEGDDRWVDTAIKEAHACLSSDTLPIPHPACEWCAYRKETAQYETA